MRAGQARKEYTAEWKREAVALVTEQGYTLGGEARNWGIHRDMLRRWTRELAQDGGVAFPGKGHYTPDQAEWHRVHEENLGSGGSGTLSKNAIAFFASESR